MTVPEKCCVCGGDFLEDEKATLISPVTLHSLHENWKSKKYRWMVQFPGNKNKKAAHSECLDLSLRANSALSILLRYGQIDGAHHKTWVIDQAVRALTGDSYDDIIRKANEGEDGPDTYEWECGTPP